MLVEWEQKTWIKEKKKKQETTTKLVETTDWSETRGWRDEGMSNKKFDTWTKTECNKFLARIKDDFKQGLIEMKRNSDEDAVYSKWEQTKRTDQQAEKMKKKN